MKRIARLLRDLPLLLISPLMTALPALALAVLDLLYLLAGRPERLLKSRRPSTSAASVVIPNWNGSDLLSTHLPSVVRAMSGNPSNEIIVVDNGSTDGSADLLREQFPTVRLLALDENLGFGGGSNAGFRAATNDIVVLLNNDMRVEEGFLAPLLEGFSDESVFSVSCQIFFSDPRKVREETGLTQAWWESGSIRVRHRLDDKVDRLFPCFYGGGGSTAYDRHKFLELGGFDPLLAPFYMEDTDLGYMAWKRGWKALYQPRSRVYHEHRGTIGRRFTDRQIQAVLKKNFLLFTWKNIHGWRRLAGHFVHTFGDSLVSAVFGDSPERSNLSGMWRALLQLPRALLSRWRARSLSVIDDTEAFRRPMAGYYRDRFHPMPAEPDTLSVLFVSPYPICPPVHGGGVFMQQTCDQLVELVSLHLVVMIDKPGERNAHDSLAARCGSAEFVLRLEGRPHTPGSIVPHAVREFDSDDLRWLIHREVFLHEVDVIQLDYLPMAQYGEDYRCLASVLFEHDVYFQSVGRGFRRASGAARRFQGAYEYMRALRYELRALPRFDRVQVCHAENADFLAGFLPTLKGRLEAGHRAGINVSKYPFQSGPREPDTMLFIGSFRHQPNQDALTWFVRSVLPRILEERPGVRLVVVGNDPPTRYSLPYPDSIELRGFVEDIREPLARYQVFVCPVLTGSGIRVKLLEAFASGIPVVSTTLGAEGLTAVDGELCALADDPAEFARRVLLLFDQPDDARRMAERARRAVEQQRDIAVMTRRMVDCYRSVIAAKRLAHPCR
ncbi:MAG: glycosyltransferase [Thermoleophilia bacterium]|nr:glycosyltransferase [Thermoleophilia bacterium]